MKKVGRKAKTFKTNRSKTKEAGGMRDSGTINWKISPSSEGPTEEEDDHKQEKMSAAQEKRMRASGRRSKRIGTQHDSSYVILF